MYNVHINLTHFSKKQKNNKNLPHVGTRTKNEFRKKKNVGNIFVFLLIIYQQQHQVVYINRIYHYYIIRLQQRLL